MAYNKTFCPTCCVETACLISTEIESTNQTVQVLKCGHTILKNKIVLRSENVQEYMTEEGKSLYPYQVKGVKFAEESQIRCLIADDMGLGKSVQAASIIRLFPDLMYPVLIVCKDKLKIQWARYMFDWAGILSQNIRGSKTELKKSKCIIISYETAAIMRDKLISFGFKSIVIDECQQIKNQSAARTKAIREISKSCNHIIALSGTPIKNNASEYFSILNILRPDIFYNYNSFLMNECDHYTTSAGTIKYTGLLYPEQFREKTKSFIIRRERAEVLSELPKTRRLFSYSELGKQVSDAYEIQLEKFQDEYSDGTKMDIKKYSSLLSYISNMRKLTGLAKVVPASEYIIDFLEQTDRKLLVCTHHIDVAKLVIKALHEHSDSILYLPSQVKDEKRDNIIKDFQQNEAKRILLMATLSGGEGTDGLQEICNDLLFVERQWNPANEEQAEARLERIGQLQSSITATYCVAVGTIDEWFAEIVEKKREYCKQTLGGHDLIKWDETGLMKELMDVLASKGLKKWALK